MFCLNAIDFFSVVKEDKKKRGQKPRSSHKLTQT